MRITISSFIFLFITCFQAQCRFTVAAYISGDSLIVPETIPVKKLTHLYYTFAGIENDGTVSLKTSDSVNLVRLLSLKQENPKLKLLLSIGGPVFSAAFKSALDDSSKVELLMNSLVNIFITYHLDGTEIHWEQKSNGMFGNSFNRKDQKNLVSLLEKLRTKIDDLNVKENRKKKNRYLLALAGSSKRQYLFYAQLYMAHRYLDFINVQTYDYKVEILNISGVSSTQISGLHSNLYPSRTDSWMRRCVDGTIKEYLHQRIPSRKLIMGIPCYGNGWNNAYQDFNGLYQWAEARIQSDLSYRVITSQYLTQPDYKTYWDKQAKSPYVYNPKNGIFISFDNKKAVRKKAHYIRTHRLGGIVLNDLRQDDGSLLKPARHKLHFISFPFLFF